MQSLQTFTPKYFRSTYTEENRVSRIFGNSLPRKIFGSILDIGCSEGKTSVELSQLYPQAEIIGMDIEPTVIEVARNSYAHIPKLNFIEGDGYFLDRYFGRKRFAAIFMMNNLYFNAVDMEINQFLRIFVNFRTHLEVNGYLGLSGPNQHSSLLLRSCSYNEVSLLSDISHLSSEIMVCMLYGFLKTASQK